MYICFFQEAIEQIAFMACLTSPNGLFHPKHTLSKDQKIRVILRRSENTFDLLQWLSMRKQILKSTKIKRTFVPKIILHNYILYKGDPAYVVTFPVDSRMHQIFTDFQHST